MEITTHIGLDVHSGSISVGVARAGIKECEYLGAIGNDMRRLKGILTEFKPSKTQVVYEAGPTGYGVYRYLSKLGYQCDVIAPSLIPEKKGKRIKTDKLDAVNLARLSRSEDLTAIWVPSEEDEGYRDLVRCRHDAKGAERRAKQQLNSYFLRHGRQYVGKKWAEKHWQWIRSQEFKYETQREALVSYIAAIEEGQARVLELEERIREHLGKWKRKELCRDLMALRGVDMITAVTIVSEIGDLKRFKSAPEFMSFVGLVPSENSTGESKRRGSITKAGNKAVRRMLVESAWSYRLLPSMSPRWRKRTAEVSTEVRAISWKAQKRLHSKYRKLKARGVISQKAITAVARELAGFIWSVGNA